MNKRKAAKLAKKIRAENFAGDLVAGIRAENFAGELVAGIHAENSGRDLRVYLEFERRLYL